MFGIFRRKQNDAGKLARHKPSTDIRASSRHLIELYEAITTRVASAYQDHPSHNLVELRLFTASITLRLFHGFGRLTPDAHKAVAAIFYDGALGILADDPSTLAGPFYQRSRVYSNLLDRYWHATNSDEKLAAFRSLAEQFEGYLELSLSHRDTAVARAKLVNIIQDQMEAVAVIATEI